MSGTLVIERLCKKMPSVKKGQQIHLSYMISGNHKLWLYHNGFRNCPNSPISNIWILAMCSNYCFELTRKKDCLEKYQTFSSHRYAKKGIIVCSCSLSFVYCFMVIYKLLNKKSWVSFYHIFEHLTSNNG